MPFPARIDLPHCMLRAWCEEDAPALARALTANDAHLRAWTPWVVDGRIPGQSLEARLARHAEDFAAGREWVYGIFAPDGAAIFGGCGLYPRVGPAAIEIGYWLAADRTGRGLATEAARALTRHAFSDAAIERVEIHCDRRNAASNRIPLRLGYRGESAADIGVHDCPVAAAKLTVWRLDRAAYEARALAGEPDSNALRRSAQPQQESREPEARSGEP